MQRRFAPLTLFVLLTLAAALVAIPPASAAPAAPLANGLRISQVYGSGGNAGATYTNDFIEIFNGSSTAVSLNGLSLQYASATGTGNFGATATQLTELPDVTLQPGQYYLVQEAGGATGSPLPTPDLIDGLTPINMSGTAGKVALVIGITSLGCNGGSTPCNVEQVARIVDLVGYGTANYYEGAGAAPALSNTTAALRADGGCTDTNNNAADFAAGTPAPRNSGSSVNVCSVVDNPPTVTGTTPANGATDVAVNTAITVNFSESVDATANAFSIACPAGTPVAFGSTPALPANDVTSVTLTPSADLPNGTLCTVTVAAAGISDNDGTPDAMAADYVFSFTTIAADVCSLAFTPIYSIQGSGPTAAITGAVTTQGVVVGDFEEPTGSNQIRGFYLQDAAGDGDPTTSDGIFIYTSSTGNTVSVGQVVRVAGSAGEFSGQTQISGPTVVPCGTTGSVTPVDIALPFPSADYPERYEGMLVRLPQTLYVTEHYQLGRFGQIVMTSRPDRLQQPTNVVAPGAAALALQAANNLDRIIIDDNNNLQNPDPIQFGRGGNPLSATNTLRGGDSATGIAGVLVYDWAGNSASPAAYRVRPIGVLNGGVINFTAANPRPAAPSAGGRLRVTAANLLNYFNTFGAGACTLGVGGGATDCRGAENSAEFDRQWPKTVANLVGSGADVIGLMELENDGYGASSAIQDLVDRLNAATAPGTYALIDADTMTGLTNTLGVDAIKVGLIYKPGKVTPVGATAALNTPAFVTGGDSGDRNRPALAQAFQEIATGERFIVAVNHLKSKGSACDAPDAGDGQGNCNAVRTVAANLLTAWLAGDPTGTGDPDILIMGDLNSYAMEDPITAIKDAGYANLIFDIAGPDAYSYAFDGQWGYLDHALATPILAAQVAGVEEWHINADEPSVLDYNTNFKSAGQLTSLYGSDQYRSADHDPVIIGLDLAAPNLSNLAGYDLAWHTGDGATRLGSLWAPGAGVADNDGVTRTPGVAWHAGTDGGSVDVTGTGGWLSAWVDWNDDGDFDDAGEQVLNDRQLAAGAQTVTFNIPAGTTFGRSFNARFRLYPDAQEVAAPAGAADGGEVEDYTWGFTPNAVGLAMFSAAPAAAAPSLAGLASLAALALAALAGAGLRRPRR